MKYKKIETVEQLKWYYNNIQNNESWCSDIKYSYPLFYLQWMLATNYGFIWKTIFRPESKTIEDNNLISTSKGILDVLAVAGLAIPVAGELLAAITFLTGNVNFSIFKERGESATKHQQFLNKSYQLYFDYKDPFNNVEPPELLINVMGMLNRVNDFKMFNNTNVKFPSKPKCVALTDNCVKEHDNFQNMTVTVITAQTGLFEIYRNFVQGNDIEQFNKLYYVPETQQNELGSKLAGGLNGNLSVGVIVLVVIVAFFFLMKGK